MDKIYFLFLTWYIFYIYENNPLNIWDVLSDRLFLFDKWKEQTLIIKLYINNQDKII